MNPSKCPSAASACASLAIVIGDPISTVIAYANSSKRFSVISRNFLRSESRLDFEVDEKS